MLNKKTDHPKGSKKLINERVLKAKNISEKDLNKADKLM